MRYGGTRFADITLVVYPMSCAVCGFETCAGTCTQRPQSPEQRVREAALKKAEQLSPGDTLPDYEDEGDGDEDDDASEADLDPSSP